jgi:hypothetical protein
MTPVCRLAPAQRLLKAWEVRSLRLLPHWSPGTPGD